MYVNVKSKPIFLLHLLFFVLAVNLFYFQEWISLLEIENIIFVDGNTFLNTVINIINSDTEIENLRSSWLLYSIYFIAAFLLGTFGIIIFNHFQIYLFYKINLKNKISFLILLLFTPFYFISSLLPNKEVPILLLTGLFIYSIYKKKLFIALVLSIMALLIRDGHGFFLIIVVLMLYIKFPIRLGLFLTFIAAYVVDSFLKDIHAMTGLFVLERTLWFFESNDIVYLPYIIRIFATITNLGSRVFIFDFEMLSVTGLCLYLSGIGIVMAFLLSIYDLYEYKKNNEFTNFLASFYIFALLMFSVSPLIQPRYLIPIAFIYLINQITISQKKLIVSFIISIVFLFILKIGYILTIGIPEVKGFSLDYNNIFFGGWID